VTIQDLTNQALDAIEQSKVKSSASLYADDLQFTGPVPMPLNKDQYLDLMEKVTRGVPNWNFHRHDLRVEGQTVIVPVQVTGTHSQTLPGLMPGMPDLPPTHRSFRIPPEVIQITFRGHHEIRLAIFVEGGWCSSIRDERGLVRYGVVRFPRRICGCRSDRDADPTWHSRSDQRWW
jgi:SnoaL-like domain